MLKSNNKKANYFLSKVIWLSHLAYQPSVAHYMNQQKPNYGYQVGVSHFFKSSLIPEIKYEKGRQQLGAPRKTPEKSRVDIIICLQYHQQFFANFLNKIIEDETEELTSAFKKDVSNFKLQFAPRESVKIFLVN